ncbi:MAG: hypothetical protein KJ622_02990 [Alphaproteobacteria bacterium]|nr:hypothetical protein [Alphaproteobacteria bacterium]
MARVLVAFASREGHTELIAHHVVRQLEDRGHLTRLINLTRHEGEAGADDYDATIIAGSIHVGSFAPEVLGFLMRHGPAVREHVSAFLPVSLSAASHDDAEIAAINEIADRFLFEAGWQPEFVEHVAGAVYDRELNAVERTVLHMIMRQHETVPDPSGSTVLTDWGRLDEFIGAFAAKL